MNGALIHLLLNHVPIMGTLFVFCLILYGKIVRSDSVTRAALVALVVTSLVSIPAFLSGEEAEHIVRDINALNKTAMETHEDTAQIAFWFLIMNGAIALGTLLASRNQKSLSGPLVWINLIMVLLVFVLMARTGWSGGQIRHSEIHFDEQVPLEE